MLHLVYSGMLVTLRSRQDEKSFTVPRKSDGLLPCIDHDCPTMRVVFRYFDQRATRVFVTGSFVNWELLLLLERDEAGQFWRLEYQLPYGHHRYRFVVDGKWAINHEHPFWSDENGILHNVVHVRPPNILARGLL
ncbi:unnamed protein product, partial [Mesorhabditis spiculigera]